MIKLPTYYHLPRSDIIVDLEFMWRQRVSIAKRFYGDRTLC